MPCYLALFSFLFISLCTGQTTNIQSILSFGEGDVITSSLLDKNGNLWFGTSNHGAYVYDGKTFTHFGEKDGLNSNGVGCLMQDNMGNIWFGADKGAYKYDGKTFTPVIFPTNGLEDSTDYVPTDFLISKAVRSILEDKSGNIWMGTNGRGVYRFDGKTFTNFLHNMGAVYGDGLHHNVIQSMVEDTSGNIWFASMSHGYITRYDGEVFFQYTMKDGIEDDMVFSLHKSNSGDIWISTRDQGLFRYDGNKFTRFSNQDALLKGAGTLHHKTGIRWLPGDRKGNLYFLDGKSFAEFKTSDGKALRSIRTIIEDKAGNIWFGGRFNDLYSYDGITLTNFTDKLIKKNNFK